VEEFTAVGVGGLALTGRERAVVVSMGTGTAFIWAEKGKPVRHLCGSGVGGGTLAGLCSRLCGTRQYDQIVKLAATGDVGSIDLTVGDITRNTHPSLPLDITAANFGNVSDTATAGDFAAGTINMVLQSIGTTAVMACRACSCDTVVATGFMSNLPQARPCFDLFTRLHKINFLIPEHAAFATSIGAALCSVEKEQVS
jgi:type II pantothenate kinase